MLEVRYRWETGYLLPGLPQGPPDQAHCLLHQKLQLLNCCIRRKKAREEGSIRAEGDGDDNDVNMDVSSETEEDEFFDCDETVAETAGAAKMQQKSQLPIWSSKAEGRDRRLGKLRLLEHDDFLYIPICQVRTKLVESG